MAVIKDKLDTLKALTATALSLPGMLSQPTLAAEGDEVDFQYSHYQEGKRDIAIVGTDSAISSGKSTNPIEVESLHGGARITLTDRVKFAFNYNQDTWSGATPLGTTPYMATGNSAYEVNGIVAGASPYASSGAALINNFVDVHSNALFATNQINPESGLPIYKKDTRLTHVMVMASPETRKAGDFKLSYDWDNAAVSVGGGISIEDDYDSRFGNLGTRLDFNQKQTILNVDLSYTNSYTHAVLDHDDYTSKALVPANQYRYVGGKHTIHGIRQDWATHLGLSQIVNKDAVVSADFSYTRSTGYLSNPYKGVAIAFADFEPDPLEYGDLPDGVFPAKISFFTEQRPEVRNQYGVGGHYTQYVSPLDAALHFNYNFSADDWGVQSHAFDADWVQPLGNGWTVTPRVRYYSQDAADFYTPYLVTPQAEIKDVKDNQGRNIVIAPDGKEYSKSINTDLGVVEYFDAQGNLVPTTPELEVAPNKQQKFDPKKLPAHYSSDQRLSGYGALSGGVTVAKQFAKGLTLEAGFEYYTHQGSFKIGGGGEASYANFDYWLANAALKVNLDALSLSHGSSSSHAEHHAHAAHELAGLMFGHMLPKAGDFMVGYRFMWSSQGGGMLNGSNKVADSSIIAGGCNGPGSQGCFLTPSNMAMSMHMLDLMYAPTDWLTLMLMPQFVDMHMDMRKLDGANSTGDANLDHHITHHLQNAHETGGIGDLGMYALFKVFDNGTHHVHATTGFTAPTGDVNKQFRRSHGIDGGFQDYSMQLGSGSWDFKPSLTYTGHLNEWSWGTQANGTVRTGGKNKSGYRLGDIFQATVWGGYNLTNWLTASVRGVYTVQGTIRGQYNGSAGGQFVDHTNRKYEQQQQIDELGNPVFDANGNPVMVSVPVDTPVASSILKFGPNDYPSNYGGRFWDVGFGLSATVPSGSLAGNRLAIEWLQPVHTDYNGYQLDRDGTLSATWSVGF